MTWLKKAGQVTLRILGIAITGLPLFSTMLPASDQGAVSNAVDRLKAALGAITTAEQMITASSDPNAKTGSQKLAAASPFVGTLVQEAIKELTGKAQPKDPAKLEAAIKGITSNLADALNSYGD